MKRWINWGELSFTLNHIPDSLLSNSGQCVHFTLSLWFKSSLLQFSLPSCSFIFLSSPIFSLSIFSNIILFSLLSSFPVYKILIPQGTSSRPPFDARLPRVPVINSLIKSGSVSVLLLRKYYTDREQHIPQRHTQPPASQSLSHSFTLYFYSSLTHSPLHSLPSHASSVPVALQLTCS